MPTPSVRALVLAVVLAPCACVPDDLDGDPTGSSGEALTTTTTTTTDDGGHTDGATTSSSDDPCVPYCEVVDACEEGGMPDCVDTCHILERYRDDNFDAACQAASVQTRACIATLTCDAYADDACETDGIAEYEACAAGGMPKPGVQALCTLLSDCGQGGYGTCVQDLLEWDVRDSYLLGCEQEHDALMACVGGLTCEQYADEAQMQDRCAAQIAALDAACPTFGDG